MDLEADPHLLAARLGDYLIAAGARLATAESCTGGGIAATCTAVEGSSNWFEAGFVTYSEAMKQRLLGVSHDLFIRHGAVSEPVARAMAEGALMATGVELALAVTGIAGPTGGEVLKPVGTVWFAWAQRGQRTEVAVERLEGDRESICRAAVVRSLSGALALLAR